MELFSPAVMIKLRQQEDKETASCGSVTQDFNKQRLHCSFSAPSFKHEAKSERNINIFTYSCVQILLENSATFYHTVVPSA